MDEALAGDFLQELFSFLLIGRFCGLAGGEGSELRPGHLEQLQGSLVAIGEYWVRAGVVGNDNKGSLVNGFCGFNCGDSRIDQVLSCQVFQAVPE